MLAARWPRRRTDLADSTAVGRIMLGCFLTRMATNTPHPAWKPRNYQEVASRVEMARKQTPRGRKLAAAMASMMLPSGQAGGDGFLPCPSPHKDRQGKYRVAIDDSGRPDLQRLDPLCGRWSHVATPLKVSRARWQKRQKKVVQRTRKKLAYILMTASDQARPWIQKSYEEVNNLFREITAPRA